MPKRWPASVFGLVPFLKTVAPILLNGTINDIAISFIVLLVGSGRPRFVSRVMRDLWLKILRLFVTKTIRVHPCLKFGLTGLPLFTSLLRQSEARFDGAAGGAFETANAAGHVDGLVHLHPH